MCFVSYAYAIPYEFTTEYVHYFCLSYFISLFYFQTLDAVSTNKFILRGPMSHGKNGILQENDKILKNYDKLHKMITKN